MESHGYEADRFENVVSHNFRCPICLNVLKEPVMCQRNEHFFCRGCITQHLENSPTCPSCKEELTLETLTPAPRILTGCLSELNIRCDYCIRGCREVVQLGNLESHVKNCGFSPVVCSNEGCLVEINKRDRIHHEAEVCELRKVKCHDCAELAKEIDEVKMSLAAVNNDMGEIKMNLAEIKEQLTTLPGQTLRGIQAEQEKMMKRIEMAKTEGKSTKSVVVVAGGYKNGHGRLNSVETYSWYRMSWEPLQSMKECRDEATAVIYKDRIIVSGGSTERDLTDSMESLAINPTQMDSAQWSHFPAKLPSKLCRHSSVVYNGRLIVIGGYDDKETSDRIHEVSLDPPYTSQVLTTIPEAKVYAGVELLNDKILIVGGSTTFASKDSVDSVMMYNINKNQCKQMAPLPFAVCEMATVSWGHNVILIGGKDIDGKVLNTVVIYNVESEKSHMLPAMRCERKACTAVVAGNAIVVMGGIDEQGNWHNSVESFSFDRYSWEEFPPMSEARAWATAVAC